MNVQINLIANTITNYIQKYYKLDSVALQLISASVINGVSYIDEKVKKINFEKIIDENLENLESETIFMLINLLVKLSIFSCIGYVFWNYKETLYKHWMLYGQDYCSKISMKIYESN